MAISLILRKYQDCISHLIFSESLVNVFLIYKFCPKIPRNWNLQRIIQSKPKVRLQFHLRRNYIWKNKKSITYKRKTRDLLSARKSITCFSRGQLSSVCINYMQVQIRWGSTYVSKGTMAKYMPIPTRKETRRNQRFRINIAI